MMAYTPGPWRWEGGEDLWHFGNGYECHGASDPHRYTGITIDKTLRDSEILHGNMALVAAAPELLEALEICRKAITRLDEDGLGMYMREDGHGGIDYWPYTVELLQRIDTIIAKAKGECK